MVKGWRNLIWMIALGPVLAQAAPSLELVLDHSSTELGMPLRAELRAGGGTHSLSHIDLERWRSDFGVRVEQYEAGQGASTGSDGGAQVLELLLYPRRTGELELPPLYFAGARTQARVVHVDSPHIDRRPIKVATHVEPDKAWERQQILIWVEITTPEQFASLQTDELVLPDFEVVPIEPTRKWKGEGDARVTVLRAGWALFPLTPGAVRLELPPVRYRSGGSERRVFYPPHQPLSIRALPPYVPPLMPVGKVSVRSTVEPRRLLSTDTLAYWTVTLKGKGLTPYQLPAIGRQIQANPAIEILPVESRRSTRPDTAGVHGQVVHQIPFKATASGSLDLPPLKVQYFDPTTGKVLTQVHRTAGPLVLATEWQVLSVVVALLVLQAGIRRTLVRWRAFRQRRRFRKTAISQLENADNPHGLRSALVLLAQAEGWPANLSVGEWARRWSVRYWTAPEFYHGVERLRQACYGSGRPETLEPTRQALLRCISARKRRTGYRAHSHP